MYNAVAVANYFVQKALIDNADMTAIKLVKMTYIAHGWHLAITGGKPLINEPVVAWRYGPIVQSVYHAFKKYGREQVISLGFDFANRIAVVQDKKAREILDRVWEVYKEFTGSQLAALTHKTNSPWDKVRHLDDGKSLIIAIISNESIFAFYRRRVRRAPKHDPKRQSRAR